MNGINKVILVGNIVRDAELRHTPAGKAVSTFSLATSRVYFDGKGAKNETVQFHNIVFWNSEKIYPHLKKSKLVYVEGSIDYRSWEDKDGNKKYKTEILVHHLLFLGAAGKPNNTGSEAEGTGDYNGPGQRSQDEGSGQQAIDDSDLPF